MRARAGSGELAGKLRGANLLISLASLQVETTGPAKKCLPSHVPRVGSSALHGARGSPVLPWARWGFKAHLQPGQPLQSSPHTQIIIGMVFFFSPPNYFQYLDFKNWNKKLFQVMQLQRKIYWDQLKTLLFL